MSRVVVRSLTRELSLRTSAPEVRAGLMHLNIDPTLPGRELTAVSLDVEPVGAFFRISPPGVQPSEGSLAAISQAVYRLLTAWWTEDFGDFPILHAATAIIDGRRMAFVGDKRAGKTTLMLRLIEEGYTVHGDELVLVTADGAISIPRRLHVRETTLAVLPGLAERIRAQPTTADWLGNPMYACPPSIAGAEWMITEGPLDALVILEPNFGGSSVLSPLARDHAFAHTLAGAFMPETGQVRAAARLRRLAFECDCWRLQTGDLDQAIDHLQRLASKGYGYRQKG